MNEAAYVFRDVGAIRQALEISPCLQEAYPLCAGNLLPRAERPSLRHHFDLIDILGEDDLISALGKLGLREELAEGAFDAEQMLVCRLPVKVLIARLHPQGPIIRQPRGIDEHHAAFGRRLRVGGIEGHALGDLGEREVCSGGITHLPAEDLVYGGSRSGAGHLGSVDGRTQARNEKDETPLGMFVQMLRPDG